MTITLYKKDSASGTVYDSSVIESLSVTQNADIMADIVPIDTAICRIRSETPLVAEYMDVDDNTGITGRPLSPLVAPIGHYVVKQINNLGNNLYEIQGYSLVYRLDTPKVPAKYYNGVSLSVALKDVEKNANGSFGVTYNVDTALSGKTITGYCPEQTARERLQQFCWAVGGYVSCACSALINILAIPSTVQGTVPKSKIYAFPAVANEDEVARVNLTVHTYTAGTNGDDIVIDADGNKYVHTTSTLTMANTALTGVSNREVSVDNATLVNSSNAQATLLRMASVYFNSGTWYGTTTPQGYIPGQMVQAEDRDGIRQGYISALTYSFGKGAATTMELKQSVSIQGLSAPVLSVTSTNETLWITSSDDRVTSFMLYDNDTLIHTFTQLSTPTASITNGTMSWNSITNADGYIVNAVKDGATQSKSVTETSINLSAWLTEAGTYSLTVKASGYGYIMSEESAAVAYTIQNKLATPTIAMNADGKTLEITDVANATSYDVYVDGTMKTNVASVPSTTTFDLSTLSDITDGAHTVKVKAKASGYNDSEFSNEVSYTKTPVRSFANDSPAVIQASVIDGSAINLYNVGDQKEITLTDGSTITIRIVNNSASMYQLSDGTRNTGFVVEFVDCFKVLQYMNSSNTKTGGWNSSYMRNTMMNTIFNLLPSEWQNVIPSVNVISDDGAYPSPTKVTSSDKLFLPAEREVSSTSYRDSDINSSSKVEWDALKNWSYYTSGGSRIKKYNNQNYQYWLRSPAWTNTSKFCSISDGGSFATTLASGSLGVAPAFCL